MLNRIAWLVLTVCFAVHATGEPSMQVTKQPFGKMPDGAEVELYTLSNGRGLEATVLTLGATLHTVSCPGRHGQPAVITLHLDTVEARLKDGWATGAVVGRFANRIANASFNIDGVDYKLEANFGKHQIHGGAKAGFKGQLWKGEPAQTGEQVGVKLTLVSPDGQGGYPGTATVTVIYALNTKNELSMDYTATTDKATYINLANHAYWNLAGAGSGDINGHLLQINAEKYLAADKDLIPSGEILDVKGTPLDFTTARTIGSRVNEMPKKHYDPGYVLKRPAAGERFTVAARVVEPTSGRVMEVLTTQPGLQFFTGNPQGLCLETQHYPDSPHHPAFPSTLLRPGETLHETTIHRFSVEP